MQSKAFNFLGITEKHTEEHITYTPLRGLALLAMQSKKTLLVTDPLSYDEYDENIDLKFENGKVKPIICVPIMDREEQRLEGCIEAEFKMKNYLSSHPLNSGEG